MIERVLSVTFAFLLLLGSTSAVAQEQFITVASTTSTEESGLFGYLLPSFTKQTGIEDRAGILPRPKRRIPIWLGGFSEAAFDRAAMIGDGFLFSGRTQTEAIQIKARITAKLRELGRDADAFGFESIQQYSRGDNQWPGDIAAWRQAGGSHISVVTMGANLTTVDGHIEAIKRWRDVYNSVH